MIGLRSLVLLAGKRAMAARMRREAAVEGSGGQRVTRRV